MKRSITQYTVTDETGVTHRPQSDELVVGRQRPGDVIDQAGLRAKDRKPRAHLWGVITASTTVTQTKEGSTAEGQENLQDCWSVGLGSHQDL